MQGSVFLQRVRNKKARDQRIAAVRVVVDALAPDEKEELLIGYLAEMEMDADEDPGENADISVEPESPPMATANDTVHIQPPGFTVKHAIVAAMRDGRRRSAGLIATATKELHPWVNVNSVPAALARLVGDGVLIKRGKTERGHPKYVMAPTPPNEAE